MIESKTCPHDSHQGILKQFLQKFYMEMGNLLQLFLKDLKKWINYL